MYRETLLDASGDTGTRGNAAAAMKKPVFLQKQGNVYLAPS
jgi:hypothetical protein